MKRTLVIITILLMVSSCTMPGTKIYSIYAPEDTLKQTSHEKQTGGPSVVLSINAPRYLAQPYIAVRNSPYELEISRYAKWESSPDDIVKEAFRNYLASKGIFKEARTSAVVPEGFYAGEIDLKKFERYDEPNESFGILAFDIKLHSPEGKELYRADVFKKVKLGDKTFLSLAKGLSDILSESVREVSDALREVVKK